jgi:hypothetical protein
MMFCEMCGGPLPEGTHHTRRFCGSCADKRHRERVRLYQAKRYREDPEYRARQLERQRRRYERRRAGEAGA